MTGPTERTSLPQRVIAGLVRGRRRLPRWLNALIDDVAKNPDGPAARLADVVLGGRRAGNRPAPTAVPDAEIRVYVGPTNYAGQGDLWARALEAHDPRIGARNMAVELPGGFAFPADSLVPIAVYNSSPTWRLDELAAVRRFSHVLIEAERPLFGRLFRRDISAEVAELRTSGVSCAFLAHGTDIRSPRRHLELNRWSPYLDDPQTELLQRDADDNLALLESLGLPVFVSTPDLLLDVPWAAWCPIVVDLDRWTGGRELFSRDRPIVVHIPSRGAVKGTQLIEPVLRRLHDDGVIEYRSVSGVPSARVPELIGDADIVLDQFRIGSYGVAAGESMAAGRVTIGHVLPQVRRRILDLAGVELPLVEADPETLESVLLDLIADPDAARAAAAAGTEYVRRLHSGRASSESLLGHWIDAD